MVRQPDFHAPQYIEQQSYALPEMIAGLAQPRIAHRVDQAFGLRQRFARMRQDVLLLAGVGATQPQIDEACQFRARQRFGRAASSTSPWLPSGNRTICRAAVGDNSPTRKSSRAFEPSRSISASRRHTQLL